LLKDLNTNKAKFYKSNNDDYDTKNADNIGYNTDIMCNEFIFKSYKFPNQSKLNFNKGSQILK